MPHGVAVALNVGDLLVGGVRHRCDGLLPEGCDASGVPKASPAIRGQGAELLDAGSAPMKPVEVLEIFRSKTAPAFEVAFRWGRLAGLDLHGVQARCMPTVRRWVLPIDRDDPPITVWR